MDGMVLDSEISPRSFILGTTKIPVHHCSLENWEQPAHYWEKLKKEKAQSASKVMHQQAVARNGLLASMSQGKVEVIPWGLSVSNEIGQPSQYKGWSYTMQLEEKSIGAWWVSQALGGFKQVRKHTPLQSGHWICASQQVHLFLNHIFC